MNRNEFITSLFRVSILVSLGVIIAFFVKGNKISLGRDCSQREECRACKKAGTCNLPEAEKFRSNG